PEGGGEDPGPGRAADPRLAALRAGPRRHGGRAEEGERAAGEGSEDGPGGAVGRGLRERRPDGPRTTPRRGAGRRSAGQRVGRRGGERRARRGGGRGGGPALPR